MAPVRIGTSGFSYAEWKPGFYPPKLPQKDFLGYYASQLPAVEIDSTFYRFPRPTTLESWRNTTGPDFRFALKAPQKITHRERLEAGSEATAYWTGLLPTLGERLGIVLYQLPPFFKRDDERLGAFLGALPTAPPVAFEFRHPSWYCPDVYALLRARDAALCIRDEDAGTTQVELTAERTYLRLRRGEYTAAERQLWLERITAWADQGIEVFAFIKHEDNPKAPAVALQFAEEIRHTRG
jgi:uncharacterized protein YecE (DUF72 family)